MDLTQNYYLTWENGQLVTADSMTAFSDGVAGQILALTDALFPIILSGGRITYNPDGTINVSSGYYRIANQKVGNLEIPGYFYVPATSNLKVNNGQYVVARIVVSTMSRYTTIISGKIFVVDTPTTQDIVLHRLNTNNGITEIQRANDLQLIIPAINKSNQLIVNNAATATLQINPNNQQVVILNIAQNAKVTLPTVIQGIYSVINNTTNITFYLLPNAGYTILGKTQYLITPGSTLELRPATINKNWIFL